MKSGKAKAVRCIDAYAISKVLTEEIIVEPGPLVKVLTYVPAPVKEDVLETIAVTTGQTLNIDLQRVHTFLVRSDTLCGNLHFPADSAPDMCNPQLRRQQLPQSTQAPFSEQESVQAVQIQLEQAKLAINKLQATAGDYTSQLPESQGGRTGMPVIIEVVTMSDAEANLLRGNAGNKLLSALRDAGILTDSVLIKIFPGSTASNSNIQVFFDWTWTNDEIIGFSLGCGLFFLLVSCCVSYWYCRTVTKQPEEPAHFCVTADLGFVCPRSSLNKQRIAFSTARSPSPSGAMNTNSSREYTYAHIGSASAQSSHMSPRSFPVTPRTSHHIHSVDLTPRNATLSPWSANVSPRDALLIPGSVQVSPQSIQTLSPFSANALLQSEYLLPMSTHISSHSLHNVLAAEQITFSAKSFSVGVQQMHLPPSLHASSQAIFSGSPEPSDYDGKQLSSGLQGTGYSPLKTKIKKKARPEKWPK